VPSRRYCTAGEVVADQTPSQSRTVHLEYRFDRLLPDKLVQAYELLASDRCSSIAPSPQPASCQEVVNEQTGPLYARVSSDRQKENHTIASQVAALTQYAEMNGYVVPPEWQFQDDGYSGATLVRPGLEALRDLAAGGQIQTVLIYSPDRLSRKYAYQVLLAEELARTGVELIFLRAPSGATAEDQLLILAVLFAHRAFCARLIRRQVH